jgi:hypothetical protein
MKSKPPAKSAGQIMGEHNRMAALLKEWREKELK